MSARAPINGDQTFRETFGKADSDPDFGYLTIKINIEKTKFEVEKYATNENGDNEAMFKNIISECQESSKEKEHRYFIIRDPTNDNAINQKDNDQKDDIDEASQSKNALNLYILIHYAPDLCPVKQRMMYASSRPTLKAFLGNSAFSEDYHCSSIEELSLKKIIETRTLHHKIDFRSDAEIEKEQAAKESVATSAKSQVMRSLPIDIKDSAKTAIDNYKSESCKCVFLTLNAKTQAIEGEEKKCEKISDIRDLLTDKDPKYILFWYSKSKRDKGAAEEEEAKDQLGDKRIFGYYCPDKADRTLRFTYSTCKTNVVQYCNQIGLEFYSNVEMTTVNEINEDTLDYHIFPVKEKKEEIKKAPPPKSKRKGKRGKRNSKSNILAGLESDK